MGRTGGGERALLRIGGDVGRFCGGGERARTDSGAVSWYGAKSMLQWMVVEWYVVVLVQGEQVLA